MTLNLTLSPQKILEIIQDASPIFKGVVGVVKEVCSIYKDANELNDTEEVFLKYIEKTTARVKKLKRCNLPKMFATK